jgi:hypothetical protein
MCQVAPRWTGAHPLLVHVQHELIVGAYVHDEVLRLLRKFDDLVEVQNDLISLRGIGRGDPLRTPQVNQQFGRKLCDGAAWIEQPECRENA